jgi:hypothetical protein
LPAARRAFDAQQLKLADQVADRSVDGHPGSLEQEWAFGRSVWTRWNRLSWGERCGEALHANTI